MPRTPRNSRQDLEITHRRDQVVDLYLQGYTQGMIAQQLGISQPTVSQDLKAVRAEWRASTIRDFDLCREVELQKLDRVEREAWAAWQRSQKPSQSARFDDRGGAGKAHKTVRNQYGDPRLLQLVLQSQASRRVLLGLEAQAPAGPQIIVQLSPEERERHMAALLREIDGSLLEAPETQGLEVSDD